MLDRRSTGAASICALSVRELIEELLNAVLFLVIGLELIVIVPDPRLLLPGVLAVPLALAAARSQSARSSRSCAAGLR